ncbi:hypothetical protein [Mycobacterium sp. ITM-2016-00318]|uniref:hypothetical protein n=1 Tax=Mycobacterium sp. ITM-2016-00318 TaxID=2099693 RepID=UPI000CF9482D|nr:hypothetical protein [Mycobacterium sp. ITM-2016-00318]WNG95289.1 hypothetical protein C6A82_013155 [Mycobacterium sp. ITM-2016-00318]
MMYLVRPDGVLQWTTFEQLSPSRYVEMGGNLETIGGWQDAERPQMPSDIAVALRYGIPVRRGIVVDAEYILDQRRPYELRELYERAKDAGAHPQIQATEEFIDKHLAPGWKQEGEDLARQLDETNQESVREALEKSRQDLEEPMKEELTTHWKSIGGVIP